MFPIIYINTVWFQFLHRINAAFGVSSKFVPYRPNYDLVCNNAIGYSLDTTMQSNAELLQRACEFYGVDKTQVHAGIISVCTNTTQEYAFYYFIYQYGGINYKAEISKMSIEITAINSWGTIALTGGTAPYHIGVLFFNK